MAIGPSQSDGPIDVTFDYVKLVEDEPENTAPEITSATATPSSGAAPLPVELHGRATDADGDQLSYSWDFGNGGSTEDATTKDATYTYTTPGTYTAKVTVSDGEAHGHRDGHGDRRGAARSPAPRRSQAFADPTSGTAPLEVLLLRRPGSIPTAAS